VPEFSIVERPSIGPTQCFFCHDFDRPMINTQAELPDYGMVYICIPDGNRPGCLGQMANLIGWAHPNLIADFQERLDLAEQAAEGMQEELLELRQLDHIIQVVSQRQSRSLEEAPD
jgi:hypothetical protein